jgi:hypothetical protein
LGIVRQLFDFEGVIQCDFLPQCRLPLQYAWKNNDLEIGAGQGLNHRLK